MNEPKSRRNELTYFERTNSTKLLLFQYQYVILRFKKHRPTILI